MRARKKLIFYVINQEISISFVFANISRILFQRNLFLVPTKMDSRIYLNKRNNLNKGDRRINILLSSDQQSWNVNSLN